MTDLVVIVYRGYSPLYRMSPTEELLPNLEISRGITAKSGDFKVWNHSNITQNILSLGIEDGALQAYNSDFEIQFAHKLSMMTRFSQADSDACIFLYLLRDDAEQLLYCYLFQATKPSDVSRRKLELI
ncbi:hypothetical protein QE152_g1458 [Popillia japonica]|uniref:Uncharacterized protein n=1 Tax=Popillia japonica TaxID=7064 RepID=A0AAW1N629_POPJA